MSSESKTVYLQPTGLFAIDAAIGNVLKTMITGNQYDTWKNIRILAYTTTDVDIIKLATEHSEETRNHLQLLEAPRSITYSYDMTKIQSKDVYLEKRNEDLYSQIMLLLGKQGYIKKIQKEIASNTANTAQLFER